MAYQAQEHTGFIGVNIRTARSNAKDQHAAKALNVDFNKELGSATVRNGMSVQADLADDVIRTIAKVNGFRFYVAGRHLYRDGSLVDLLPLVLDDGLTVASLPAKPTTDIEGMRPLNDTAIWAFIADLGGDDPALVELGTMRKDDGTRNQKWGIAIPPRFKLIIGSSATVPGLLSGAFIYNLTHIRHDDDAIAHEGNPIDKTITFSVEPI